MGYKNYKSEELKNVNYVSFCYDQESKNIVEQVYDSIKNKSKFMVYINNTKAIMECAEYTLPDGTILRPIVSDALPKGAILLPDSIEEYGSVKELVQELVDFIHTYLDISPSFEQFSAWYILLSWVYDKMHTLSYLRVLGDTGCGKSRFLDAVGGLCYKSCMMAGVVTPAPIYRMIDRWKGTIIIDEADFEDSTEKSEVVKILNCGFERNRPIIRCKQNNVDELLFLPSFCPKVIAARYTFEDKALESRCLTYHISQTDRTDIPSVINKKFYEKQRMLRNKLLKFRFDYYEKIEPVEMDIGNYEPRLKQATESFSSLFAHIPEMIGTFKTYLDAYQLEVRTERNESTEGAIVDAFAKAIVDGNLDITTTMLVARCEDFGQISTYNVGKRMKSLGITSYLKKREGKVNRIYTLEPSLLNVVFKRYIIDEDLINKLKIKGYFEKVTEKVTDGEKV